MRPGEIVAERFEIESVAGQGGMGIVYRATDRLDGGSVALKVMTLRMAGAVERFDREARILATLHHPGIVRYVAHGHTEGQPWLAMEWLEGEDLAQRLERESLSLEDAVTLVRHAAGAVGVAHRSGVVHRDLKPQNIFLVHGNPARVKVLDFGIARTAFLSRVLTQPGQIFGTAGYMAPEQARGRADVGPPADVWSLGALLYECLAGRPPFIGDLTIAVLMKALVDDPPSLTKLAPHVPRQLESLVMRMLRRDAAERPTDAGAVAAALFDLRLDEPKPSSAPQLRVAAPAITGAEQELIAVVLAMSEVSGAATIVQTPESLPPVNELSSLPNVQRLLDGSSIVVIRGAGHATDLAVRAARAALELRARIGSGFSVALATGHARLDEQMPAGEVVDRAAALASQGGLDGVRLDEVSRGLLSGGFITRRVDDGVVLVEERAGDELARTLLGKPTPFVGRKKELRMLRAVMDEAFDEHEAQAALLIGSAGCGKTRVRQELVRELVESTPEVDVWLWRGDPLIPSSSFGTLTRVLSTVMKIREGDPVQVRRKQVRERVTRHVPAADQSRVMQFIGELLGARFDDEDSQQLRAARSDLQLMGDQLRRAVLDFLMAETAAHPLLLVLEDLQWADLPSVSLLETALGRLAERPFMLLATARPELDESLASLWREHGERLQLSPLSRRAAERLARDVLQGDVATTVIDQIVGRAEGNAFFLEELLRAEVEGRGETLPPTLVAVAQARLDALEPAARRILRAASVTGLTFWPSCVLAILGGQRDTPQLDAWIDTLTRAEVVEPRSGRFAGEPEYAFRQDIVRVAAYQSFTEADRTTAHALAANWLEAAGANDPVAVAEHFEKGAQPARAQAHWIHAAERALEGQDLDSARKHATRAIAGGAEGELLGRAHLARCEAASWQLDYGAAVDAARDALPWLTPGTARFFEAATVAVACTKSMGRHDDAKYFVDALRSAPRDLAPGAAAIALSTASSHLLYAGDVEGAAETSSAAREVAMHCSNSASVLGKLALLGGREAAFRGDTGGYAQQAAAARSLFESTGDVRRTLNQQSNFGYALLELGRYEEAERELTSALEQATEGGNSRVAAFARHNLGLVLAMLGRPEEGRVAEQMAIDEFRQGGHARLEAGSRIYLARILQIAGDLDGALAEARRAVTQLATVAPPLRPLANAVVASVHLARGEPTLALEASKAALQNVGTIEAGESLVRLTEAESLYANGEIATARQAIRVAEQRLRARAAKINDESYRHTFLERVPENASTIELARRWLDEDATAQPE